MKANQRRMEAFKWAGESNLVQTFRRVEYESKSKLKQGIHLEGADLT
jgi:hypothetical protein